MRGYIQLFTHHFSFAVTWARVLLLCCGLLLTTTYSAGASTNFDHNCTPNLPAMSEGEKPVRILLQWMPQAQFAGYIMAHEKDFFAEEGVPLVELHWANLGESPLHSLARGDVEFATAWLLTGLQRRGEGLPIVNVRQFMHHSATMIVARKDKNIKSIEDLNGKTLLTWGGDFGLEFDVFLQRNNITPKQVLPLSTSLAPFLYGLVDATQAMAYSEYQRLLERGMKEEEMIIFPFADYKVNLVGDGLYTTVHYLENHRQTVKAVRRAVERGWEYAFSHEEETVNAVLRFGDAWNFRSNKPYQLSMLRSIHALMQGPGAAKGELTREDFESARNVGIEAGLPLQEERYERFFQHP